MNSATFRTWAGWAAAILMWSASGLPSTAQDPPEQVDPEAGEELPPGALETPVGPAAPAGPPNTSRDLYDGIVLIEAANLQPDYINPWNAGAQGGGSGTGFLVGPNRFLTNAHVVSNEIQLLIRKYGDAEKYAARILHIAHDCDLALLELEDPSAFEEVKPLTIGGVPSLESTVTVIGYPIGGKRLSTTRGVVSRIDFQPYSHSGADLHLAIQIDAAINPGNSGGPVVQDGEVVGVAFQGISGAQSVGYMIPTPVIRRFLTDVEDGQYDRYVDLSVGTFELINPAYRAALGLPNDGFGTLVTTVTRGGSCDGILQKGDVLLSIDGRPVAANGYLEMDGEVVDMNEIVERKFKGDRVAMTVWRDRAIVECEVELKAFDPYLMQASAYDEKPRFVFFAGLLFQPLDRNLMGAHKIQNLEARYAFAYYVQEDIFLEKPDVVVLTSILPDAINSNYGGFAQTVVSRINGKEIRRMEDVYETLHPEDPPEYFVIECEGRGMPIVMEGSRVQEAHERVMKTYRVGTDHYLGDKKDAEGETPEIEEEKPLEALEAAQISGEGSQQ